MDCTKANFPTKNYDTCVWEKDNQGAPDPAACDKALKDWKSAQALAQNQQVSANAPAPVSGILPPCVLKDTIDPPCNDVSIFITLLINIGHWLFTIIGALALVFFIYGGFVLILSRGNPEKITQGKDIMVAALIGLVVAFGGYILIKFLGDAVGIQKQFML